MEKIDALREEVILTHKKADESTSFRQEIWDAGVEDARLDMSNILVSYATRRDEYKAWIRRHASIIVESRRKMSKIRGLLDSADAAPALQ
mgnify:CR=1 FL=1